MKILKLEIEKKDGNSFLNIELDINGDLTGYSARVYNHVNKKNKIDITDKFDENNNIAKASIDLKEIGIFNSSFIVLEVEDSQFKISKGVAMDMSIYFKCILKEIIKEVESNCETCEPTTNENVIQLSIIIDAVKDAYSIGAIDELFQLANMLDKMCNSNCKNCG